MHILLATNMKKCNMGDFAYKALNKLGHTITLLSPIDCKQDEAIKVAQNVYIPDTIKALKEKPDLFLFIEGFTESWFFPEGITEVDIPTAFWATDNYLNFRWEKEYCSLFDYAFFVQLGRMKLAQSTRFASNIHWLPFAVDEELYCDTNVERDIDVGYIGSIIPAKRRYFDSLVKSGINFQTPERYLEDNEVGQWYSRCKMVYNISARFDMNVRTFEACSAGALLINQKNIDEGFYEIFSPGIDCDIHDFDDAPEVIHHYLNNPDKLSEVAKAGQKLVLENHTYRHRMQELLRVCGGVTERRQKISGSYLMHIKEAMVYQHPNFGLWERALKNLGAALKKNFPATLFYLLRYVAMRIYEKAEKICWKFGKAPV